ncbi:hypothetical protein K523DRAFT_50277 [Schizophyllum commune Tattone D]|nr:hypothetical protein K523DRAFT_50277 [Schizophyllum commune Tattone D]
MWLFGFGSASSAWVHASPDLGPAYIHTYIHTYIRRFSSLLALPFCTRFVTHTIHEYTVRRYFSVV